jgi:immunity protein Imm1 of predicted polymorphic toxin system
VSKNKHFVKSLYTDRWEGVRDDGETVNDPTLEQIQDAIDTLDGKTRSSVLLKSGEAQMGISGGDDKRYVVFATFDNWQFSNLIDPTRPPGKTLLTTGGLEAEYPNRQAVDRDRAVRAARTFALEGRLEPALDWEEQETPIETG